MKKPDNPFPTSGYFGPEYFCNRENESKQLLTNLQNGLSTTLTAIRRIGKTGLIKHVLYHLPKGWQSIYVDILATENINQFLNTLATAVINAVPENTNIGTKVWNFIKSMRPVISFDSLTGNPQASFDLKQNDTELQINSVLEFLEKQNFKVVIAIDEFQQILNYPEKNTDAWLRTIIQQLHNVTFVFSGSQQHLMNDLFASPSRPFFRSTQIIKLNKIDNIDYRTFIIYHFNHAKKEVSEPVANEILKWSKLHTFYVQLLCNRLYTSPYKEITTDIWKTEAYKILKEQEAIFYNYREILTHQQWILLKAIAGEDCVYTPTSKDFIGRYRLGSPSTVLRSLNSLLKNELIYSEHDPNGVLFYSVHDVLFQRWIEGI